MAVSGSFTARKVQKLLQLYFCCDKIVKRGVYMNKESSMYVTAAIGNLIARDFPVIDYKKADLDKAKSEFSEEEIEELSELGLMKGDFEEYYVIREFCRRISLGDVAEGDYIAEIFKNFMKLDATEIENDAYMKLCVPEAEIGNVKLKYAQYEKGEIFQYDMPEFCKRLVVPKLGFFTKQIRFPSIYEGDMPWVSVCPSEINSMKADIEKAEGNVLVLGLGLGYYTYMTARKENVKKVTVVEINEKIADIFCKHILPLMECKDKIQIVLSDAIEYTNQIKDGEYDFVYADIWEGAVDGAKPYKAIKSNENRLKNTHFAYWIEPQIKAYLEDK